MQPEYCDPADDASMKNVIAKEMPVSNEVNCPCDGLFINSDNARPLPLQDGAKKHVKNEAFKLLPIH